MNNITVNASESPLLTLIGDFHYNDNQDLVLKFNNLDFNYNVICLDENNVQILKQDIINKLCYDNSTFGFRFSIPFKMYIETIESSTKTVSYEIITNITE